MLQISAQAEAPHRPKRRGSLFKHATEMDFNMNFKVPEHEIKTEDRLIHAFQVLDEVLNGKVTNQQIEGAIRIQKPPQRKATRQNCRPPVPPRSDN